MFSNNCKLCNRPVKKVSVCPVCDAKLKQKINIRKRVICIDNVNVECIYIFDYDDVLVKRLLYALKRNADKGLFEYASELYGLCVGQNFDGVVTNVPRRKANVRSFAYDQVEKTMRILAKQNRIEFVKLLARKGFSLDQKNLDSVARQKNIRGKFRVTKKDIPKNILLADDVVTTASTFKECAGVLLEKKNDVKITGIFLASSSGGCASRE